MTTITYEKFERVNLRSGTIVKVEEFPRAKKRLPNGIKMNGMM